MIELNGRRLGIDSEVTADYAALQEGVALVDLSDRGRMRFHGDGAKPALNGLLTCDVAPLTRGHGAYGAALTNKGKVIADVTVYAMENSVLVECPPATWDAWKQLIAKFVNPRLTRRTDETDASGEFALCGPQAARAVAALTGLDTAALDALAPYSHLDVTTGDTWLNVSRVPDAGVEGFRVLGARDAIDTARQNAIRDGARVIGGIALEAARIEAGRPVWGADMDDNTIPQEANLEALGAISYTKGCYTGQEVVARLHFRGHVNKRLVGLRFDGSVAVARGTPLASPDGKECGDVRSSVVSPRYGPIALAMVRREVAVGDMVTANSAEGPVNATVTALPFDA